MNSKLWIVPTNRILINIWTRVIKNFPKNKILKVFSNGSFIFIVRSHLKSLSRSPLFYRPSWLFIHWGILMAQRLFYFYISIKWLVFYIFIQVTRTLLNPAAYANISFNFIDNKWNPLTCFIYWTIPFTM